MKVSIIGAGLIGRERIMAVQKIAKEHNDLQLCAVFDPDVNARNSVSQKFNVPTCDTIEKALSYNPDWVFICTPHSVAIACIKQAFEAKANVLVEKPLGRNLWECEEILKHKPSNKELLVGFNYRFFAGIEAALKDCQMEKFGKLISVNLVLAHGNSPGMEKSWKLDPIQCGGGCLIDPGVHLLDLILQIRSDDIGVEHMSVWNGFWKTGIEEEAHLIMKDSDNTLFNMQVSLNRWRSTFRLEINGTEGYGIVEGRGRSYGPQTYRTGKRWGWQSGVSQSESEIIVIDKDACDDSFLKETASALLYQTYSSEPCNDEGALKVMSLLEKCRHI
jgi:predicted dehydrogenase